MEFFLTITQRIFSNWTALRLAVEHDMGSKERALEFCEYITKIFYMNEGLISSQVAAELEYYMEEFFNTELLDDSTMQVAEELLKFHRYMEGNKSTAIVELEKLPPLQSWLISPQSTSSNHCVNNLSMNSDSNSNENMDLDIDTTQEWTEVKSRRKR